MKKLLAIVIAVALSGCAVTQARFMGMHNERAVYEVTCPKDRAACDQVARHACKNGDWRMVLQSDQTATTDHFWLECEF